MNQPKPFTLKPQVPSGVRDSLKKLCFEDSSGIWYVKGFVRLDDIESLFKSHLQAEVSKEKRKMINKIEKIWNEESDGDFDFVLFELKSRLTRQPLKRGKQEG